MIFITKNEKNVKIIVFLRILKVYSYQRLQFLISSFTDANLDENRNFLFGMVMNKILNNY